MALLDAVDDVGEGLAVGEREKQEARVRRQCEGLLAELVVGRIHFQSSDPGPPSARPIVPGNPSDRLP